MTVFPRLFFSLLLFPTLFTFSPQLKLSSDDSFLFHTLCALSWSKPYIIINSPTLSSLSSPIPSIFNFSRVISLEQSSFLVALFNKRLSLNQYRFYWEMSTFKFLNYYWEKGVFYIFKYGDIFFHDLFFILSISKGVISFS